MGNVSNHSDSKGENVLVSKEISLTNSELSIAILNTAARYYSEGIRPNEKVAILSENSVEFVISIYALWRINAIPVPLNIRLKKNELNEIIEFANTKYVLTSKNQNFDHPKVLQIVISLENFETQLDYKNSVDRDDTAIVLFTSGSSGKPKGVKISNNNLYTSYINISTEYNFTSEDKFLASLPFYHIGGFSVITRAILSGGTLIIPDSLSVDTIASSIEKYSPTVVSLVPTMLKRLIEKKVSPNKEMRLAFIGGGPSDDELVLNAQKLGWPFVKVYGSTETCSMISGVSNGDLKSRPDSGGRAFKNVNIKIYNNNLEEVENGIVGEIGIKSESVAIGYLNQTNAWEKKLHNDFYLTGDYGFLDEEGFLFVVSRRTDLIVSGGENIDPLEIEKVLLEIDAIKETIVFPIEDEEWGQVPVAVVVYRKGREIEELEIILKLKQSLSSFKIPKKIFYINKLPRNELGKVDLLRLKTKLDLS